LPGFFLPKPLPKPGCPVAVDEHASVRWRTVDVHEILADLYTEHQRLDEAIAAMEGLATTGQRRRGRPPKWLAEARKSIKPDSAGDANSKKIRSQPKRKAK